ncbi:CaiB/BaiF CoA transferase family protein [Bosea sp. TAF32]|uniref:CaiB/BaiF CoA transferase family protein n=1 Tax=Bosea sp. TAF32 TaxID=3237482 RepID=UPI003F93BDB2
MSAKPLRGLKVLEFSHMIMGPTAGLLFADLGADVVKIEPAPEGDHTRSLPGFGAGFFPGFNRNKRSLAIDLKNPEGRRAVHRLVAGADIVIENYGPGTMERLGCGYEELSAVNPRLLYLALKGFLGGPYERRPALDEVIQFQTGLAYMTGPPGRPLRAGSSITDILGGIFGVTAVLAALSERNRTGKGQKVGSALFETGAFLMLTHMAGFAATGNDPRPMPIRHGAWAIYNVFDVARDEQVFIGVTSNMQWSRFVEMFGLQELAGDPRLASNALRNAERSWLLPRIQEALLPLARDTVQERCVAASIPFAPVGKPTDLFDDAHLLASGGLLDVAVTTLSGDARTFGLPALPVGFDGARPGIERQPPTLGEHTVEILTEIGHTAQEIALMDKAGVIAGPDLNRLLSSADLIGAVLESKT